MRKTLAQICLAAALPLNAGATAAPSASQPTESSGAVNAVAIITPEKVTLAPNALSMTFSVEANRAVMNLTMFGHVIRMSSPCENIISLGNNLTNPDTHDKTHENLIDAAGAIFEQISQRTPLRIVKQGEISEDGANLSFAYTVIIQTNSLHEGAILESAKLCKATPPPSDPKATPI